MDNLKLILISLLCFCVSKTISGQLPLVTTAIDKIGKDYVKSKKNRALVIGIIKGDEVEIKGFGKMSKQYAFSPNANTLFEVGSITFPFTTTLMLLESQKGKFALGDQVQNLLPDSIYIPNYRPEVCIEAIIPSNLPGNRPQTYIACSPDLSAPAMSISFCDLASHTSGLRNSPKNYFNWSPFNRPTANDKNFRDCTKFVFYQTLADCDVQNEPGTFYRYSNAGMALLGNVLGEINDTTYQYLIEKNIFQPLSLHSAFFEIPDKEKHRLAPPHYSNGRPANNWQFDAMKPAGGLVISAQDLLHFVQANLMTTNAALSDAFVEVQQSRIDMSERKFGRPTWGGYGWFISTLNKDTNQPVIWQNGATGGYRSFVGFVKDTNIGVVILSNSGNNVEGMGFEILEMLH